MDIVIYCEAARRIRIFKSLELVKAKWRKNVELLRPVDFFCDSECATMEAGNWLYFDRTHFTVAGSYYMVRRIEVPLTSFLLAEPG